MTQAPCHPPAHSFPRTMGCDNTFRGLNTEHPADMRSAVPTLLLPALCFSSSLDSNLKSSFHPSLKHQASCPLWCWSSINNGCIWQPAGPWPCHFLFCIAAIGLMLHHFGQTTCCMVQFNLYNREVMQRGEQCIQRAMANEIYKMKCCLIYIYIYIYSWFDLKVYCTPFQYNHSSDLYSRLCCPVQLIFY